MFSFGFGAFIFLTVAVITVASACYHINKTDKVADVRLKEIELEREKEATERARISLEKGKLKASGEFAE